MRTLAIWISLATLIAVGACSSDSSSAPSAGVSGDMCADADAVQAAVGDLTEVDVVTGGTDALQSAIDDVKSSLSTLKASASDELSAEVTAVETSLSSLETAISSLGDGGSLSDVGSELSAVGTAVQGLVEGLGQCE